MVSKCGQRNIYPNIGNLQITLLYLMTSVSAQVCRLAGFVVVRHAVVPKPTYSFEGHGSKNRATAK